MNTTPDKNVLIAVILGVSLIAAATVIGYPDQSDYVTVGGQAQAAIEPDGAAIYFSINSYEDTAEAAQAEDAAMTKQVTDALKALEDGATVETTTFFLNRRTEWTEDGVIEKGYDVYHSFKVSTNVGNTDEVIATAVGAGANGIDRIEYTFSRDAKDVAVAKAMEQATAAAHAKADRVARSLGGRAGRPLKIEEGSWWVVPSDEAIPNDFTLPAEYAGSAIIPQRLAVQANVNAVFVLH